jgi:hypothetical protein
MKIFIVLIGIFLIGFNSYGQVNNNKISGQVKDTRNEPLASATVTLLQAQDSILVQTKMTKENGRFIFDKLPYAIYRLRVTVTGNKPYTSGPLTLDSQHTELVLPLILLQPEKTTELKGVTVIAKRPLIEQELDKTIVNADAMIGSAAGNTLDILEKTPGVTVDQDGSISLNGNGGVMVLIDGKTIYMSGRDLAAYLRSLPGSMVDKIELMTNPPARYDAGGNGIINIRLKRNRTQGYTGTISLNASQGKEMFRSYNSANINYLNRKVNLFVNAAYSRDGNFIKDNSARSFYETTGTKNADISTSNNYRYRNNDLLLKSGMDYTFSSKTVAGFVISYDHRPRKEESVYSTDNNFYTGGTGSTGNGNMNGDYRWKNFGANINLTHKPDQKGKELSLDVNYIRYNNYNDQYWQNTIDGQSTDSSYDFLYDLYSRISIYNAKADYMHPIGKLKLSTGTKFSWVENDMTSDYFDIISNTMVPGYAKSNHFIYRENINAAYVNGRRDWKRVSAQLGLRLENTAIKGEQVANPAVGSLQFTNNYTNVFPSAFISYKLDSLGKHTLSVNFSKRLNRPGYQQLNPFIVFRDQYSYTSGNPSLGAGYGTRYELVYRFGQYIGLTVQHDRLSDNIIDFTESSGNVFLTKPANRGAGHLTGLFINSNYSPAKGWTLNLDVRTARFYNKAFLPDGIVELRQQAYRVSLFSQYAFPKDWSSEIFFLWNSRMIVWQRVIEPRWRVNLAVQKKILKKKGSIRLGLEDIFYAWKTKTNTVGLKNITAFATNVQDTRRVSLGFSFSFGKETFARKRKVNDNAADDLKGRVE